MNGALMAVSTDLGAREHPTSLGLIYFFDICSVTYDSDYSLAQTLPWRHAFRTETLLLSMRHAVCVTDVNAQVRKTKQMPGLAFLGNIHGFLSCHKQKLGI